MWSETIFLKAPSEAAFLSAAGDWINHYADRAVDVVGDIEGATGFHVNVRLRGIELPESLAAFVIAVPEHPKRDFS